MATKFDVAVMHDFYVDRLLYWDTIGGIARAMTEKARVGGGGIHRVGQEDVRGGNAVNLAYALSRLGLRTLLITHSDRTHEGVLRQTFDGLGTELRVKPFPTALTVAFEGEVNVMMGDGRGASDFGPDALEPGDWRALSNSRLVCVVNWAINMKGTKLLTAVRRRLGAEKTIFFDPADFRDRAPEFKELLGILARRRVVDWVSMNQQEATAAAPMLGIPGGSPEELCVALARRLRVVFDLHGDKATYTSEGTRLTSVRVRASRTRRLTGAGDIWDAGAVYGRLTGMEEGERLRFANGAAKLYLESKEPLPPTAEQVYSCLGRPTSRASSRTSKRPCSGSR